MIEEGKKAPSFSLKNQDDNTVSLKDFKGKKVVLYFYPKDNTPGCTKEACKFRDMYEEIKKQNAVILGVSADSVKSHTKFKQKYELPFDLLSDPDKELCKAFGVIKQKSMFGNTFLGITRTTFIIDEQGVVEKVFPKVKVKTHDEEVLDHLQSEK